MLVDGLLKFQVYDADAKALSVICCHQPFGGSSACDRDAVAVTTSAITTKQDASLIVRSAIGASLPARTIWRVALPERFATMKCRLKIARNDFAAVSPRFPSLQKCARATRLTARTTANQRASCANSADAACARRGSPADAH